MTKIQLTQHQHPPDAPHPEWATCSRMGCANAALYGINVGMTSAIVCRKHLPDVVDAEFMGKRWWEDVPEELQ